MGGLTLRLPPGAAEAQSVKRTSGPAAGAWCGRPWCPTWSWSALPVSARDPSQVLVFGVLSGQNPARSGSLQAAGRALQPPAAGPRPLLCIQVSPMQAQEAGGGGRPKPRCAGPWTERQGPCSLAFPLGLQTRSSYPLPLILLSPRNVTTWRGPVLTLRPIRVLDGSSVTSCTWWSRTRPFRRSRARWRGNPQALGAFVAEHPSVGPAPRGSLMAALARAVRGQGL